MHPIACLVLALAAAVSAVPAPSDNAVANGLEIRQECLFECLCDSPDDEPVTSTGTCCASVSGSLNNGVCCIGSLGVVSVLLVLTGDNPALPKPRDGAGCYLQELLHQSSQPQGKHLLRPERMPCALEPWRGSHRPHFSGSRGWPSGLSS
jgi:hypothetical protein